MATLNSDLVVKKIRHRGLYSGKEQSVTGSIKLSAGASVATTDLMQMVPLGENVRPIRILLQVTPLSGTPVLTNAVFDVGVKSISTTALTRPNGTSYPALITDADQLAANVTLANNTKTTIEIPRPVADSVANYGPYYVTLTPDTSAFSVAGGDILVSAEVVFLGEIKPDAMVYTSWNSQKVTGV
jgi:hypothetical protein